MKSKRYKREERATLGKWRVVAISSRVEEASGKRLYLRLNGGEEGKKLLLCGRAELSRTGYQLKKGEGNVHAFTPMPAKGGVGEKTIW